MDYQAAKLGIPLSSLNRRIWVRENALSPNGINSICLFKEINGNAFTFSEFSLSLFFRRSLLQLLFLCLVDVW